MPETTLDSILADVRGEVAENPYSFSSTRKTNLPIKNNNPGTVSDVKYNVQTDAIYDRLSDGSYAPKFQNYKGGIGNENRLAEGQGFFEQAAYGIGKAIVKTGNYALDATVGTVYGIVTAIGEGTFEGMYDNDFSNTLDDWNESLDRALPNYYTDEQKSMGVMRSMLTVNFWANDVAGGLAFVGGALLPEIAIAAFTGGASLPTSFAKIGLKAGTKSFLKTGVKEGVEKGIKSGITSSVKREAGLNLLRGQRYAKIGSYTGEVLKTGGFMIRTSNFEAGMEARHNLHQSTEEYLMTFKELNGRQPTEKEFSEFMDSATSAANWVYGSNMAILSISNLAMFGTKFGVGIKTGKKITNFGNKAIGLSIKKTAGKEVALAGANRTQRFLGNTYLILGKAAVEGIYEEGLQGVAGSTMQNYLKAKYSPETEDGYGLWASLTDAFSHQYGTKEGWKEMSIGMIIGFGGGAIQGQGFSGLGKNSRKNKEGQILAGVNAANTGVTILKNVNRATSMSNFKNMMESESDNTGSTELYNSVINADFIKTQEHLKTPGEIRNEFNAIVDNMTLTQTQIEELGGTEAADVYKDNLKQEFSADIESYRTAKDLIKSLNISESIKDTAGNISEISESLVMNMMIGKSSLRKAKVIAGQIDSLIGTEGAFNHLEHYNNLSKKRKKSVVTLKQKKRRLADLKKLAIKAGQQVKGVNTAGARQLNPETSLKNFHKYSEKLRMTQTAATELEEEITAMTDALNSEFRAEGLDLDGTVSADGNFQDAEAMIEELDKLDSYRASLETSGRTLEAANLDQLMTEFKMYSDANRQMNSDFRRMFDTNFFSSKKGKGLRKFLLGKGYKMSDEFRELIKENDELIDASLRKSGMSGYKDVQSILESHIENNEELSDREKFRLESIIRTILGAERIGQRLEDIQNNAEIVSSMEQTSSNPLEGDTIRLKKMINPEGKDLSNLDVLNEIIDSIVEEIDELRNLKGDQELIENSEQRLAELKDTQVEEESKEGDYQKAIEASKTPEEFASKEDVILKEAYKEFLKKEKLVADLKREIKELKGNHKFKIAATDEYQRLKDLSQKRRDKTATVDELAELRELSEEIDQWIMITGTIVEGLRLSDLIKQKFALENALITKIEVVEEVTSQEKIDQIKISNKTTGTNYSYGQTYEGVTAVNTPLGIEISGINPEAFELLAETTEYKTNEQGNIIITEEVQKAINEKGTLAILPTNKDLTTNYSVVLETKPNVKGENETGPLISTFNKDFNGEQNADAIYDQKIGDALILEVNPTDVYNVGLLQDYQKAMGTSVSRVITDVELEEELSENSSYTTLLDELDEIEYQETKATTLNKPSLTKRKLKKKEQIQKKKKTILDKLTASANKSNTGGNKAALNEALDNLRTRLVIRVKDSEGNFMAVLKSKRYSDIKSVEQLKFEALRDQVVGNDEFLMRLAQTGVSEELTDVGTFSVKKVLIGHPNFNFVRAEDGSMAIESREITEEDLKHITDIGFVQEGRVMTKTKDQGINTSFISRSIDSKSEAKIPFVVVKKGNTKIAYPVKAIPMEKESTEEFRAIFEAAIALPDKAIALNTYMAEKGIDIKLPGNSFIGIHKDNINSTFFAEKLAQVESINYFQDLNSWLDPKVEISSNVLKQVMVDVKLHNPFHSPKLQMDLSGITAITTPVRANKETVKKVTKSTLESGSGVDSFLNACK